MQTHPNIIYLNSHDTGRWIGCLGAPVETPTIDQLAAEGVLFSQMHSGAPTCSPSRAALLTGQMPHTIGMLGNVSRGYQINEPSHHLGRFLGEHGYTTAHIGVYSLKPVDEFGYDESTQEVDDADQRAADFIRRQADADKPFFLDVGFMETHRAPGRGLEHMYRDNDVPAPPYTEPDVPPPLYDLEDVRHDLGDFQESAASLDRKIETVIRALKETGQLDDTLVIYTTDHGPPFPGMKSNLNGKGIGVAMILRGPSGSPFTGGKTCDALLSQIDLYPTLCEWTGIPKPDWLQGVSFLPAIVNGDDVREAIFAEKTYHAAYEPLRAIRTKRWSYIRMYHDYPTVVASNADDSPTKTAMIRNGWLDTPVPKERLFDLQADPDELHNLAGDAEHLDILVDLRRRLEAWMAETNDPILRGPVPLPEGIVPVAQSATSPWDGR